MFDVAKAACRAAMIKKRLRSRKFLDVVHGVEAAQLAMSTAPDVGDVFAILQKAQKVVKAALSIATLRRHVKGGDAFAELVCLFHPAMLHAGGKRVHVVLVIFQLHVFREDALPLTDRQLLRLVGGVGLLHRDEQLDGVPVVEDEGRPEVVAGHLVHRVHENLRRLARHERQSPLLVGLEQVIDAVALDPFPP